MRRVALALVMILAMTAGLALAAGPSADAILASLKKGFAGINDYRADVCLTVKGPSVSINNMRMTVYFKKPNRVHVDADQGMAMVPKGSFLGNPMADLANGARPVYVRSERKLGRDCHVLKLVKPDKPAMTLWVDREHTVLVAAESPDMGIKSAWCYEKIDGGYYLPVEIRADMRSPGGPSSGRTVKAVLKFSNYRVNKGISDKVFDEKPRK